MKKLLLALSLCLAAAVPTTTQCGLFDTAISFLKDNGMDLLKKGAQLVSDNSDKIFGTIKDLTGFDAGSAFDKAKNLIPGPLFDKAKALLFGMAGSIIITDIIMFFQCNVFKATDIKAAKVTILSSFYRYGIPIAMADLGLWVISQSNRFVLQHFKGASFNGILGVGYNLTFSTILQIASIITMAAIPRIFEVYESGCDTKKIISKLTSYYLIIFSPIVFILFLYPREIVALFSNKFYSEAHIIIPFLAVSVFLYGLSEYTTIQYHLTKKTYITTIIRIIPGVLGLLLSICLIPRIGLVGIGISTLISYALYFISSILINVKNLKWNPPYKDIIKIIIALTCCGIYVYLTRNLLPFIPQVCSLALIYIALIKLQKY